VRCCQADLLLLLLQQQLLLLLLCHSRNAHFLHAILGQQAQSTAAWWCCNDCGEHRTACCITAYCNNLLSNNLGAGTGVQVTQAM
jgi:hypothetical protein